MLPALSGCTCARVAPSTPFHFRTTGKDAATSRLLTLKDEPVTVTVSPALPAELDRLRVARLGHAKAAAPAMTAAVAVAPKTTDTFLRRFIPTSFSCLCLVCRERETDAGAYAMPAFGLRSL